MYFWFFLTSLSLRFQPTLAVCPDDEEFLAAILMSTIGVLLIALNNFDGRRIPSQPTRRRTFGVCGQLWYHADADVDDEWHRTNLRMSRDTFNRIVKTIQTEYESAGLELPHNNAKLNFRGKVAMTIFYLAGNCSFREISNVFCYSKSSCVKYINEMLDVLQAMLHKVVRMPSNQHQW